MTFQHTTGESFTAGGFLSQPGTYHCLVTAMEENVTNKNMQLIDNAAFRVTFDVLDGTAPGGKGKTGDIIFFFAKPGSSEEQEVRAKNKIDRFFLAVNMLDESDTGKTKDFDLNDAIGQQFLVEMEEGKNGYLQMRYANIYHVDDPAVEGLPKDAEALKMIHSSYRRIGNRPAASAAAAATKPVSAPVSRREYMEDVL